MTLDRTYTGEGVKIARTPTDSGRSPRGGPADKAGLKPGDVITAFEGTPGDRPRRAHRGHPGPSRGEEVTLTVRRGRRAPRGHDDRCEARLASQEPGPRVRHQRLVSSSLLLVRRRVSSSGPERLPEYAAASSAGWSARPGAWPRAPRGSCADQLGPEFDDIDWQPVRPAPVRPAPDRPRGAHRAARRRGRRAAGQRRPRASGRRSAGGRPTPVQPDALRRRRHLDADAT